MFAEAAKTKAEKKHLARILKKIMKDTIIQGDALEILKTLPSESVDSIITSPPYWALRDYGIAGQLGLEPTMEEYINKLCDIFDEAKRVLKKEGTLWVNIGDTYNSAQAAGTKKFGNEEFNKNRPSREATHTPLKKKQKYPDKTLLQIPSRFAIEMADRGWILRNKIIWHKPNCMPASVGDRFTVDFEEIFFFVQSKKYYFSMDDVREPHSYKEILIGMENAKKLGYKDGADYEEWYTKVRQGKDWTSKKETGDNFTFGQGKRGVANVNLIHPKGRSKRTVWSISTKPFDEAHFATFPEDLLTPMIKAGAPRGGVILDMFMGAGTTAVVANNLDRHYIGIELNPEYIKIAEDRLRPLKNRLF